MMEFENKNSPEMKKEILAKSPYLSLFIDRSMDRGEKLEKLQGMETSYDLKLQKSVSPDWKLALTSFIYCGLALGALTTKDAIETNEGIVKSMFYIGYELGNEDRMELLWADVEKQLARMRFLPEGIGDPKEFEGINRHRKAFVWSIFLMAFEIKERQHNESRENPEDEKVNKPAEVSTSITSFINSLSSIDGLNLN